MANLHIQGRVKRAQNLVYSPFYFIFGASSGEASEGTAGGSTLDMGLPASTTNSIRTSFLGGRRATQVALVREKLTGETVPSSSVISVGVPGGTPAPKDYRLFDPAEFQTLVTNNVVNILVETYLTYSSVVTGIPAGGVAPPVEWIYVVSNPIGSISPGQDVLTAGQCKGLSFVTEAVVKLGTPIPITGSLNRLLQLVLEI